MANPNRAEKRDVLLVSMPFGPLYKPSIGLSLLDASLLECSISSQVVYYGLKLAAEIGDEYYHRIAEGEPMTRAFMGEWIFSSALFAGTRNDADYLEEVLGDEFANQGARTPLSEDFLSRVLAAKSFANQFLDHCLDDVVHKAPRIVGFTSTFQQHVASLALAKRIKESFEDTFIVFGGGNCEGVTGAETLRQFPFVDAVVSGEGDLVFRQLADRVLNDRPLSGLPGVYTRDRVDELFVHKVFENAPRVQDMDALPYPDYDDYFVQFEQVKHKFVRQTPDITFETSRGCWWGEKSHCTFCGLNGAGMAYRSKSADRAFDELHHLSEKYPGCTVDVVDNILNMNYFKDFIPALARLPQKLRLFYETKSNLKKHQVELLSEAGITTIQPGIESLSTNVLTRMRKGVSAIQNIQLLKWSKELNIRPYWNILWGFPGESARDYAAMADLIPFLTHLPPPLGSGPIHLDRFSPLFDHAEDFGFADVRPFPAYFHIYPLEAQYVSNLAYSFTYDYRNGQSVDTYVTALLDPLAQWQETHDGSALFYIDSGAELHIWDLRPAASVGHMILQGLQREIYLRCDSIQSIRGLQEFAQQKTGDAVSEKHILKHLQPLLESGVLLQEGAKVLALALPLTVYEGNKKVMRSYFQLAIAPVCAGNSGLSASAQNVRFHHDAIN